MTDLQIRGYSLELDDLIGEGASGKVYSGLDRTSKKLVALKVFDLRTKSKWAFYSEVYVNNAIKAQRKNRFVAKVHTSFQEEGHGFIVMKKYDCDLYDYMMRVRLSEKSFRSIFQRICRGIQEMHRTGVAHLDMKPENILMKKSKPYISDMGSSWVHESSLTQRPLNFRGTLAYSAPETRIPNSNYDPFLCDVFALGVLFHTCLTGLYPFTNLETKTIDLRFAKDNLTPKAYNLMSSMLLSAEIRPSIHQILRHPWFKQ